MKILITAGGTREYIDGVRYIGNCSSGQTGADLADYLTEHNHQVTWLGAKSAIKPKLQVEQVHYETFDELASALQKVLSEHNFDVVFQAAAVSDFKVTAVELDGQSFEAGRDMKLPTANEVKLVLGKQPKLVSSLKGWSKNPDIEVVAFKLTNCSDEQNRLTAVRKLIDQENIDWVAHNDLQEFCSVQHAFKLFKEINQSQCCENIKQVADCVIKQLEVAA
jgi:phosphopantothenoylcysteine synthetase/decarboxylase